MDEGFPGGRRERGAMMVAANGSSHTVCTPLNQRCASSAVVPPRSIPNRVVKRGSANGTGGMSAGSVGPCTPPLGLREKD